MLLAFPLDCDQQKLRTAKYKVVSHFEKKLEEPMCDDYGDYVELDDCDYDESEDSGDYDDGFNAGYEAAKKDLVDSLSTKSDVVVITMILSEHLGFSLFCPM